MCVQTEESKLKATQPINAANGFSIKGMFLTYFRNAAVVSIIKLMRQDAAPTGVMFTGRRRILRYFLMKNHSSKILIF